MRSCFFALPLLLLIACATSDPVRTEPDAETADIPDEGDTAASDVDESDSEDNDPVDDLTEFDGAETVNDTADEEDAAVDAATEPEVSSCDAPGSECQPFSSTCDSTTNSVVFCGRCGFVLEVESCGQGFVCDDSDGTGECRECEADECALVSECTPNTTTCLNFQTQQTCNADGTVGGISRCRDGRRCLENGNCGNAGQDTAAACTSNIGATTGCAGEFCICGSEYVSAFGSAGCAGTLTTGYCSTADCSQTGCDPANEVCVDFSAAGAVGSQAVCVNSEGCSQPGRPCGARAGFVCQELPSREVSSERVTWGFACWADLGLNRVAETCSTDSDCAGGECVRFENGGTTLSYCSAACDENRDCPSNARCVEDPRGAAGYICLAKANSLDCPRLGTDFNVRSYTYRTLEGTRADVCFVPVP
jgi:hypothetical protein